MTTDLPKKVNISELQLADVIDLGLNEGYSTATVERVRETTVKCLRPYVHDAGFSCTSGVITYIGWEYVNLYIETDRQVTLLRRSVLK